MITIKKIIFTIDFDAFFAQAEEKRNLNYLNKPIGIGYFLNGKGVLLTCNYPARNKGIKGGEPIYKALKLESNLIIVEPDYDYYSDLSEKIFSIISKYSSKIEIASIDECYIDVTNKIKQYENPIFYAKKIQQEIFNKMHITVSIGISENKILSKIASSFNKPFGITTLFQHEIKEKLWNLDLEKMYGIGFRTAIKFKKLKINKIGEIANLKEDSIEYQKLRKEIGINLTELIKRANGIDNREIKSGYHFVKSLSHVKTFEHSIEDYNVLKNEVFQICEKLVKSLEYRNLYCKVVAIQMKNNYTTRYINFKEEKFRLKDYQTKQKTLKNPTNNIEIIFSEIISILDQWYKDSINVTYIGVKVTNFVEKFYYGKKQFIDEKIEELKNPTLKNSETTTIINYLNQKIGKEVFFTAYSYKKIKRFHDKSFSKKDSIKFKRWE
ncbi:MAG: DNA polymerase IV [Candidatus Hepatoplasma vulgare]|nr:MAG: DNA polymerase IV [Candidatus Hepatoplasma sp.]